METNVYFGRISTYDKDDGTTQFYVDYMSSNGVTHRDKITQAFYNRLRACNFQVNEVVIANFDVDIFNRCVLVDIHS